MHPYYERALELKEEITERRRWLHAHAETGAELPQTMGYIKETLSKLGLDFYEAEGGGLLARAGGGQGKTLLIRADCDALPQLEASGEDFACTSGACHSCGHDIHTAALLGAARILKENEAELKGEVRLCFQPDEERILGAKSMISAGVMQGVDAAVGIHVNLPFPAGEFNLRAGGYLASSDMFEIIVKGVGAHGSAPENGVDPIYIGAKIVEAASAISAREVNALTPLVLTFGSFNAGDAPNVIPGEARLSGTIRAFEREVRDCAKKRLEEIAKGIAASFRAEARIDWLSDTPCVYNDPELTAEVKAWLAGGFGEERVHERDLKLKASDDFAYYGETVPALMFHVGAGLPENGCLYGLHNPKARFSEDCLAPAAAALAIIAREYSRS
ncbi:MAG: M20 family metallopeptidase [Oscillospiraceae bacterium]|nr:M20 family metallopeptidase [Oscillospiraceae bacterium]